LSFLLCCTPFATTQKQGQAKKYVAMRFMPPYGGGVSKGECMTDIIDRLRNHVTYGYVPSAVRACMDDAAKEIERLRAVIEGETE
jgi:hypothetical protein